MLGYDFMLLQMAPFIQDNLINKITQGFVVRDSLLHGVGVAKRLTVSLPLSSSVLEKVMKARTEQRMFIIHEISRKFSFHGVMTPS